MKTVTDHITFVNEQIAFHDARVQMYGNNKSRKNKHLQTLISFKELSSFLKSVDESSEKKPKQYSLNLLPEDLEGLPAELMDQLSITSADKAEFLILSLMENAGGIMSLDQILVQYYKETKEVIKRTAMTNRMYRMVQKGLAFSVPHKKGVYSTTELDVKEVSNEQEGIKED